MDKIKERTGIYHEQQQGALCAQHALNNLLQIQMFSPDTLADIARELDAEEKSVLTHSSAQSENMDDTGFFSIQVLQRALKMYDIELVPYGSQEPIAKRARSTPENVDAYICNLGLHWFAIRRFGRQFFNLNSIYYVPELVPDELLQPNLNLIQENGYSVFIVDGTLPPCLADQQLSANPISEREFVLLVKDLPKLIMDDQIIGDPKNPRKGRQPVVHLSKDLYDEFQKNPNNPHIRGLIQAQLPKGTILAGISKDAGSSHPHHQHGHHLLITTVPERGTTEQSMGNCDCSNCRQKAQGLAERSIAEQFKGNCVCPNCRQRAQGLSKQVVEQMTVDPDIDNLNQRGHGSATITEQVTQYLVEERNPNNPNAPPQQRLIINRRFIVTQSSNRGNSLIDNPNTQQMGRSSMDFENNDELPFQHAMVQSSNRNNLLIDNPGMHRMIRSNMDFENNDELLFQHAMAKSSNRNNPLIDNPGIQRMIRSNIGFENNDELLFQHAMAESMLDEAETDAELDILALRERLDEEEQKILNTVMAISLLTNKSTTEQLEQTPELIPIAPTNSSTTLTMNSEPEIIKLPSSLATSSPASTNTHSPPLTNTYSPPSTNTHTSSSTDPSSPSPTNTSLPPPSNTSLPPPSNTSSPPLTNTCSTPPTNTSSSSPTNTYPSSPPNTASPPLKTTNSPPPTETNSDYVESPSVEELRQRRLQFYGYKDRSIISQQSNIND